MKWLNLDIWKYINYPPKKEKKSKKKVSLLNKDSKKKINNFESSLINNILTIKI